jgi:ferredoxin
LNVSIPIDENRPVPIISLGMCDGCGLCILVCPKGALALQDGKAVVVNPLACEYAGQCEAVCPVQAITRPFYFVPWTK